MRIKSVVLANLLFMALLLSAGFNFCLRAAEAEAELPADRVVVIYFHNTMRCFTCNNMEQFTKKSLNENFSKELAANQIIFTALNMEEDENAEMVEEFGLVASSVVLLNFKDNEPQSWKRLDRIWKLSRDEAAFKKYIKDEISAIGK